MNASVKHTHDDLDSMNGCWVNGIASDYVSALDRGFQFGDGLFEVIPVKHGKLIFAKRHLDRLIEGCKILHIQPPTRSELMRELREAAKGHSRAVLKLMVSRGPSGYAYHFDRDAPHVRVLARFPLPEFPDAYWDRGIHAHLCSMHMGHNGRLAGLKHMNRLEQVMAQSEWTDADDAQEGLMTDVEGSVIGGTASNVFAWLPHGVLATPSLRLCGVAGVVRGFLMEKAEAAGIQIRCATLSLSELMQAPEIFVCSSLIGVWPVVRIGHWKYSVGDVTRRAQAWYQEAENFEHGHG